MLAKKINIPILLFPFFLLSFLGIVLSCGNQQEAEFQAKADSPPVISSVSISPINPNKESSLTLSIQNQNPSGGPVTFRYQWIKNDEEIPGENEIVLKSGNFRKGDLIRAKVTPSNGKADGNPVLSFLIH